jgi:DNA-binding CsgD family transcriptional regulator
MTTALFGSTSGADRAFGGRQRIDPLEQLSPRELEVLELMAEGWSNRAIGEQLTVEIKTVETHVSRVFTKLGLHEDRHENRRVLAVLTFFGRTGGAPPPDRSQPGPSDGPLRVFGKVGKSAAQTAQRVPGL